MVIFGQWRQQTVTLSLKPNSFTISLQQSQEQGGGSQVFSFDASGRLWTAMQAGISYRRGLNGKTVAKWQTGPAGRERRWLTQEEATQLEESARQTAVSFYQDLSSHNAVLTSALTPEGERAFQAVLGFLPPRYQQDVQHYHQVYQPVGILPPDQYMAVVLQATEGCSFNTCTFCNFYRDRRFRIKTPEEFRQHAQAVKDFLGPGLSLRRTIFLGDANALVVPLPRLLTLLDVVHEVFDVEQLGGIFAFLDGFSGDKKTAQQYTQLAKRGVRRIYIGMESGNENLLRFLKKPGRPADVVSAVQAIKASGISVGIIILLGAGGKTYAQTHIKDTIQTVNAMNLDLDDLIYFSELIESEGLEYTRQAYEQNLQPLSSAERILQGKKLSAGWYSTKQTACLTSAGTIFANSSIKFILY